jgi:hypothetical protein
MPARTHRTDLHWLGALVESHESRNQVHGNRHLDYEIRFGNTREGASLRIGRQHHCQGPALGVFAG